MFEGHEIAKYIKTWCLRYNFKFINVESEYTTKSRFILLNLVDLNDLENTN